MQSSEQKEDLTYDGYLYSYHALEEGEESTLMDYWTEHDTPFNLRDYNLGTPFSNADMFSVTGEGPVGTFRAYSKTVGQFRPEYKRSETDMYNQGVDIMLGADNGGGGRSGIMDNGMSGKQSLTIQQWNDNGSNSAYAFSNSGDEPMWFNFIGDQGGAFDFGNDDAQAATITEDGNWPPGFKQYYPVVPSTLSSTVNPLGHSLTGRATRSSFIGYHLGQDMTYTTNADGSSNIIYKKYDRSTSTSSSGSKIGEFAVYNNSGSQYVYGLPVYSSNEKNLSFDIDAGQKNYIVYSEITNPETDITSNKRVAGETCSDQYANAWLLTEIHAPSYVDRTMNGPSNDDFGGWTKLSYTKLYDDYHWRIPHTGLFNYTGRLADDKDDMGGFSSGNKQIYYVNTIETKTHIAVFNTLDRLDGLEAGDDYTAANSSGTHGARHTKKLDNIVLYAKDGDNTNLSDNPIIETIHFQYDYSVMQNLPNSSGTYADPKTATDFSNANGKLTLKRVWVEYTNVKNAGVSTYDFRYTYPSGKYPSKYSSLDDYNGLATATTNAIATNDTDPQNPTYNANNIDRWGFYQVDGEARHNRMNPWVDQTPSTGMDGSAKTFDPAAWQLKQIKLPSGGEIHVQYEQHEYAYVQDRKATAMVSISSITSSDGKETNRGDEYYLNLDDLGIAAGSTDATDLAAYIRQQYINGENGKDPEKIYFKFLYSLATGSAALDACDAEWIDGYVNVKDVQSTSSGVYLLLEDNSSHDDDFDIPRQVCVDYHNSVRKGMVDLSDFCPISDLLTFSNEQPTFSSIMQTIYGVLSFIPRLASTAAETSVCMDIDEANSYIRVPIPVAKKGGGIRVKRVLMYDAGLESSNQDKTLVGTEYVYQNINGKSSGVASNEPSEGQDENPLITYINKHTETTWVQKAISGKDREQFEGPIGAGVLPGASVGYSRIVSKNIFSGITGGANNTGFVIKEFYTTKDYPFDGTYSYQNSSGSTVTTNAVEYTTLSKEKDDPWYITLLYPKTVNNAWASQGYRFIINGMNGQPKTVSTWSGDYSDVDNLDKAHLSSKKEYEYYQPGEPLNAVDKWKWQTEGVDYDQIALGKQTEVVMESRVVADTTKSSSLELDFSIGVTPTTPPITIPWPTAVPYFSANIANIFTHVITKVISYPAIVKSVKSFQDGVYNTSSCLDFDEHTGAPMVNKSYDGFNGLTLGTSTTAQNGSIISYNFPGTHYYSELDRKSLAEGAVLGNDGACSFTKSGYTLNVSGDDPCRCASYFSPGDLIAVTPSSEGSVEVYNVESVNGLSIPLLTTGDFYSHSTSPEEAVTVDILNSGRKNELGTNVGSLASYGASPTVTEYPVDYSDRTSQVVNVLNALLPLTFNSSKSTTLSTSSVKISDGTNCNKISGMNVSMSYYEENVITVVLGDNCSERFYYDGNQNFYINDESGELMFGNYTDLDCSSGVTGCFDFCPDQYPYTKLSNIIAASAATLSDAYELPSDIAAAYNANYTSTTDYDVNVYEYAKKGKWNINSTDAYSTDISGINDNSSSRVTNAGIYSDYTVFNWEYPVANESFTAWKTTDTITKYSPNSSPIEEQNIIGVKSVAKYLQNYSIPYLMGSNTDYETVMYDSYETIDDTHAEDNYTRSGGTRTSGISHSGNYSYQITSSSNFSLKTIPFKNQIKNYGLVSKLWLKETGSSTDPVLTLHFNHPTTSSYNRTQTFTKVARVGEWTLFEAQLSAFSSSWSSVTESTNITPYITVTYSSGATVYVDDVRMQPLNAQVTTYVYDLTNMRLTAQFDDQNFGLFYQYNDEGKLTRKMVETQNGIKTVTETQYNMPTVTR